MTGAMIGKDGQDQVKQGTFAGVEVTTGPGGGIASGVPTRGGVATHYHAARLPELGDTVLAVARVFDEQTGAPLRIELRAFAAAAPGRGALAELDEGELLEAPGAIAYARLELSSPGDEADERRPAKLVRCVVTDAAPTAAAARGVAEWLRATWEVELAFGSWPAITGSFDAFAIDGGAPADWAREWLTDGEHRIEERTGSEDTFLKVLSSAWLEPVEGAADETADAATAEG